MMIDPCPSEDDYPHKKLPNDLEILKEEIKTAWEIYHKLQHEYTKQTGKKYIWFR